MSAHLLDRPVHPGANPFFATVGIDRSFRLREVGSRAAIRRCGRSG